MDVEYTDEEVDQMVNNIEQHGDIEGDPNKPQQEAQEQAPEDQPSEGEQPLSFKTRDDLLKYKLNYKTDGGKEVEEDLATILKRASGGYHFAQRMNEYHQKMQKFEDEYLPQIEQATELKEKYGKFEDYAKENPEWYEHWNNAYENRHTLNQQPGEAPQADNIQSILKDMLSQELSPVKEFMSSYQQQQQMQQQEKEFDQQYQTVEKTRQQFKDVDFDRTDPETGKSLEYEVLEFMQKSGIKDFNAAFKAYYHDNLVKMQVEQARTAQEKAEIERKKNGILDIKSTPKQNAPSLPGENGDRLNQLAQQIFGN